MHVHVPPYYKALGVAPTASLDEITRAFRSMSLRLHPDRNFGVDAAELSDAFQAIGEAYRVLSDVEGRKRYDSQHGVNFQSRIDDMRRVVADMGTGAAAPTNDGDDGRKRRRSDQELDPPVALSHASSIEEEDDDEYNPALHAPAPPVHVCASSEAEADAHELVTTAAGGPSDRCPNVVSLQPREAPVSVDWSVAPHNAPQRTTFVLRRAALNIKWGLNCEVQSIGDGAHRASHVALLPTTSAGVGSSGPAPPCSALPHSVIDAGTGRANRLVVIDAVDGVAVRSIQDVVRCVSNKLKLHLTLVLPTVSSFRLTMLSCCAPRDRWLQTLGCGNGAASNPGPSLPQRVGGGLMCACSPVQLLHCFFDTDPATMRLHRRSSDITTQMLLFTLFGTEVPPSALALMHPPAKHNGGEVTVGLSAAEGCCPWQDALVPVDVQALLHGKRLLTYRLMGVVAAGHCRVPSHVDVRSDRQRWVTIADSGGLNSVDDAAAFAVDASNAFQSDATLGDAAALELDVCDW